MLEDIIREAERTALGLDSWNVAAAYEAASRDAAAAGGEYDA